MHEVFVDTDVILDFLFDRQPFSDFSSQLLALSESGKLSLVTSSVCINNIYFITRKFESHKKAIEILKDLCSLVKVQSVGFDEISSALNSGFPDFEDAIQNFNAVKNNNVAIITRNVKDYKKSSLAIFTPEAFVNAFQL